ncbi:TIGR00725 family protein [candidate division KSB1 bacterium]|nr:TIGR00725 family protein [candidate division KSB1 bacterium]
MGGSDVAQPIYELAFQLGAMIAEQGWALLNGGRDAGVMRASAEGAKSRNGLTIGVLPGGSRRGANPFIDIPIFTEMGAARNVINVLSSDVVVALPGGAGTISEIALALKSGKKVCLLKFDVHALFQSCCFPDQLYYAESLQDCMAWLQQHTDV